MSLIKGKQIAAGTIKATNVDTTQIPTLAGDDTFTGSVSVPEPIGAGSVTTKTYVDSRVSTTISAVPTRLNKGMRGVLTVNDGDLGCATPVASPPCGDGVVRVVVNGISMIPADGTLTGADTCYFSGDGGITARFRAKVLKGDLLYWNGSYAGFQLSSSDKIEFSYNVSGTSFGPGATRLADESDVSVLGAKDQSILTFDAAKNEWIANASLPSYTLDGMSDVLIKDALTIAGQTLVYNGSKWIAQTVGAYAGQNELVCRWAGNVSGLDRITGPSAHTQAISVTTTGTSGAFVTGPFITHVSMNAGVTWQSITVDLTSTANNYAAIVAALSGDPTLSFYFNVINNGGTSMTLTPKYAFHDFRFYFTPTPMFYGFAFNTIFPTVYDTSLGWAGVSFPIGNGTWTGGVATLDIGSHSLFVGQTVTVSGTSPSGYDGSHVVTAVNDVSTTISYSLSNPGGSTTTGTVLLSVDAPPVQSTTAVSSLTALHGGTNNGCHYSVEIQDLSGGYVAGAVTVFVDNGGQSIVTEGVMPSTRNGSTLVSTTTVDGLKGYVIQAGPATANGINFATWTSGVATIVLGVNPIANTIVAGQTIIVSGLATSGYNGTYTVASVGAGGGYGSPPLIGQTAISYNLASDPGSTDSGPGTVTAAPLATFNVGVDPGNIGMNFVVTVRVLPGNIVLANDVAFASRLQIRSILTLSNTASWNSGHVPNPGSPTDGTTPGGTTPPGPASPVISIGGFGIIGLPTSTFVPTRVISADDVILYGDPRGIGHQDGVEGYGLPSEYTHKKVTVFAKNIDGTRNYDYQLTPGTYSNGPLFPTQGTMVGFLFLGPFSSTMLDLIMGTTDNHQRMVQKPYAEGPLNPGVDPLLPLRYHVVSPLPNNFIITSQTFGPIDVTAAENGALVFVYNRVAGSIVLIPNTHTDFVFLNANFGQATLIVVDKWAFATNPHAYGYMEINTKDPVIPSLSGPTTININEKATYTLSIVGAYSGQVDTSFVGTVRLYHSAVYGFHSIQFIPGTTTIITGQRECEISFSAVDRGVKTFTYGAFGSAVNGGDVYDIFAEIDSIGAGVFTANPINPVGGSEISGRAELLNITLNVGSPGPDAPLSGGRALTNGSLIPCGSTANASGMSMTASTGSPSVIVKNFRSSPPFGTFGTVDAILKLNDDTTTVSDGATLTYAQINAGLKVNPAFNSWGYGGRPGGTLSVDVYDAGTNTLIGTIHTDWASCLPG